MELFVLESYGLPPLAGDAAPSGGRLPQHPDASLFATPPRGSHASAPPQAELVFSVAAVGACAFTGASLIAAYCPASQSLLLQAVPRAGTTASQAVSRLCAWYPTDTGKRITALVWSDDGQVLAAATADGCAHLLAARRLLAAEGREQPPLPALTGRPRTCGASLLEKVRARAGGRAHAEGVAAASLAAVLAVPGLGGSSSSSGSGGGSGPLDSLVSASVVSAGGSGSAREREMGQAGGEDSRRGPGLSAPAASTTATVTSSSGAAAASSPWSSPARAISKEVKSTNGSHVKVGSQPSRSPSAAEGGKSGASQSAAAAAAAPAPALPPITLDTTTPPSVITTIPTLTQILVAAGVWEYGVTLPPCPADPRPIDVPTALAWWHPAGHIVATRLAAAVAGVKVETTPASPLHGSSTAGCYLVVGWASGRVALVDVSPWARVVVWSAVVDPAAATALAAAGCVGTRPGADDEGEVSSAAVLPLASPDRDGTAATPNRLSWRQPRKPLLLADGGEGTHDSTTPVSLAHALAGVALAEQPPPSSSPCRSRFGSLQGGDEENNGGSGGGALELDSPALVARPARVRTSSNVSIGSLKGLDGGSSSGKKGGGARRSPPPPRRSPSPDDADDEESGGGAVVRVGRHSASVRTRSTESAGTFATSASSLGDSEREGLGEARGEGSSGTGRLATPARRSERQSERSGAVPSSGTPRRHRGGAKSSSLSSPFAVTALHLLGDIPSLQAAGAWSWNNQPLSSPAAAVASLTLPECALLITTPSHVWRLRLETPIPRACRVAAAAALLSASASPAVSPFHPSCWSITLLDATAEAALAMTGEGSRQQLAAGVAASAAAALTAASGSAAAGATLRPRLWPWLLGSSNSSTQATADCGAGAAPPLPAAAGLLLGEAAAALVAAAAARGAVPAPPSSRFASLVPPKTALTTLLEVQHAAGTTAAQLAVLAAGRHGAGDDEDDEEGGTVSSHPLAAQTGAAPGEPPRQLSPCAAGPLGGVPTVTFTPLPVAARLLPEAEAATCACECSLPLPPQPLDALVGAAALAAAPAAPVADTDAAVVLAWLQGQASALSGASLTRVVCGGACAAASPGVAAAAAACALTLPVPVSALARLGRSGDASTHANTASCSSSWRGWAGWAPSKLRPRPAAADVRPAYPGRGCSAASGAPAPPQVLLAVIEPDKARLRLIDASLGMRVNEMALPLVASGGGGKGHDTATPPRRGPRRSHSNNIGHNRPLVGIFDRLLLVAEDATAEGGAASVSVVSSTVAARAHADAAEAAAGESTAPLFAPSEAVLQRLALPCGGTPLCLTLRVAPSASASEAVLVTTRGAHRLRAAGATDPSGLLCRSLTAAFHRTAPSAASWEAAVNEAERAAFALGLTPPALYESIADAAVCEAATAAAGAEAGAALAPLLAGDYKTPPAVGDPLPAPVAALQQWPPAADAPARRAVAFYALAGASRVRLKPLLALAHLGRPDLAAALAAAQLGIASEEDAEQQGICSNRDELATVLAAVAASVGGSNAEGLLSSSSSVAATPVATPRKAGGASPRTASTGPRTLGRARRETLALWSPADRERAATMLPALWLAAAQNQLRSIRLSPAALRAFLLRSPEYSPSHVLDALASASAAGVAAAPSLLVAVGHARGMLRQALAGAGPRLTDGTHSETIVFLAEHGHLDALLEAQLGEDAEALGGCTVLPLAVTVPSARPCLSPAAWLAVLAPLPANALVTSRLLPALAARLMAEVALVPGSTASDLQALLRLLQGEGGWLQAAIAALSTICGRGSSSSRHKQLLLQQWRRVTALAQLAAGCHLRRLAIAGGSASASAAWTSAGWVLSTSPDGASLPLTAAPCTAAEAGMMGLRSLLGGEGGPLVSVQAVANWTAAALSAPNDLALAALMLWQAAARAGSDVLVALAPPPSPPSSPCPTFAAWVVRTVAASLLPAQPYIASEAECRTALPLFATAIATAAAALPSPAPRLCFDLAAATVETLQGQHVPDALCIELLLDPLLAPLLEAGSEDTSSATDTAFPRALAAVLVQHHPALLPPRIAVALAEDAAETQ